MASSKAMRRALQRLESCQKNHPQCSKKQKSLLPTRVINVGSQGDEAIKLHITQKGECGQYLTLSYCWGKLPQYTTTKKTIEEENHTIQLDSLPQTIKDAISVTRQLGIQYLWIDALCIIQDCDTDKSNEISRMHEVYKNSYLTISASTTFGVVEGFLYNIPAMRSFQLPIRMRDGSFVTSKVTLIDPAVSGQPSIKSPNFGRQREPLDERGWALQESLLSSRLLIYGRQEMSWKCQEDIVMKVPCGYSANKPLPSRIFPPTGLDVYKVESKGRQIAIWQRIIEDYSGRKLTCPDDRMIAISGIVHELSSYWKDTYIAGMWYSCLIQYLAWEIIRNPGDNPTVLKLHLPSWSWVSYFARVLFLQITDIRAKIIDHKVVLQDEEAPFGAVTRGYLTIGACSYTIASIYKWVKQSEPATHHPADDFCFDNNAVFDFLTAADRTLVLILGFSKSSAIGIIVKNVGEEKYMRLGVWRCKMTKTSLHQFANSELYPEFNKLHTSMLFTII